MTPEPPKDIFPDVPDQGIDPVEWDPRGRRFVARPTAAPPQPAPPAPAPAAPPAPLAPAASPARPAPSDQRRFFVGPDAVGKAPPPRAGGSGAGVAAGGVAAPPRPAGPRRVEIPAPRGREGMPARPASPPTPSPAPAKAKPRRRRWRPFVIGAVVLPLILLVTGLLWANWKFSQIERVEVGPVLSAAGGGGTNYLIVGSDSREGTGMDGPGGQRSDTMLVLRIERGGSRMLSIPRDLYVTQVDGSQGRINGAYNDGPAALIQTVQQSLGIPVHRYLEVDFVTFAGLVDAVGGVTIDFPYPVHDDYSGLVIPEAGAIELNGETALAYVRSRQYVETIDGRDVADPTADLGRITRQQLFLRTVLGKLGSSRNPISLMRAASSVTSGLRIDDKMSLIDAIRFAWRMKGLEPEPAALPTTNDRVAGAAVLRLVDSEAQPILDLFR